MRLIASHTGWTESRVSLIRMFRYLETWKSYIGWRVLCKNVYKNWNWENALLQAKKNATSYSSG